MKKVQLLNVAAILENIKHCMEKAEYWYLSFDGIIFPVTQNKVAAILSRSASGDDHNVGVRNNDAAIPPALT